MLSGLSCVSPGQYHPAGAQVPTPEVPEDVPMAQQPPPGQASEVTRLLPSGQVSRGGQSGGYLVSYLLQRDKTTGHLLRRQ